MSVFTPVSPAQARALLAHYSLGDLESLEGIAQGVENTLTTNLNGEITRAKAAESLLTTNLNNEVARAKSAENRGPQVSC